MKSIRIPQFDDINKMNKEETYSQKKFAYDKYMEERAILVNGEREVASSFDKTILTLAGGAIGLSITFIEKVAEGRLYSILAFSWIMLITSLVIILLSMYFSKKAYDTEIQNLDGTHRAEQNGTNPPKIKNNCYTCCTNLGNFLGALTLIIGIALLAIFSYYNILAKEEIMLRENNKTGYKHIHEGSGRKIDIAHEKKGSTPPPPAVRPPQSNVTSTNNRQNSYIPAKGQTNTQNLKENKK